MRDLWDQERSCPGRALMMMPEAPRRKEQLSDKAPNHCMELGLLGMVLLLVETPGQTELGKTGSSSQR